MNVQLSDYKTFDVKKLVFSKPESGSVAGNKIVYKRIRIGTEYEDGTTGDLILQTPEHLLSFGLQETTDPLTGAITGYQFPICLWNRTEPSEDEKLFTQKMNDIVEHCKNYLVAHREDIEKYDLELTDLKKFNPLYWKMEKGKIVDGRGPMLYIKCTMSKKTGEITTGIIDDENNTYIDPMSILRKRCYVTAAVKFESIFIGNKISLQLKLYEIVVRTLDNGNSVRGLLRPNARPREVEEVVEDQNVVITTTLNGHDQLFENPTPKLVEKTVTENGGDENDEYEEIIEEEYPEEAVVQDTTTTPIVGTVQNPVPTIAVETLTSTDKIKTTSQVGGVAKKATTRKTRVSS